MREDEKKAAARRFRKKLTRAEVLLWSRMRDEALGWRFRRQHPVGPYIADFACIEARVVVEVDGATQSTDEERAHDARRDRYLESQEWRIVRITNSEVMRNKAGVTETILRALEENYQWLQRKSGGR